MFLTTLYACQQESSLYLIHFHSCFLTVCLSSFISWLYHGFLGLSEMVHFFRGANSFCILTSSLSRLSTISSRLPLSVRLSTLTMLFYSSLVNLCSFLISQTSALGHTFLILRVGYHSLVVRDIGSRSTVSRPVDCVISLSSKSRMFPD